MVSDNKWFWNPIIIGMPHRDSRFDRLIISKNYMKCLSKSFVRLCCLKGEKENHDEEERRKNGGDRFGTEFLFQPLNLLSHDAVHYS